MARGPGKGVSNNPGGKPKLKPWTDALRMVANEGAGGHKKLRRLAEKTYEMAMNGDIQAIREFGNRLEGTPMQSVNMEHDVSEGLGSLLVKLSGATRGLPSDDSNE